MSQEHLLRAVDPAIIAHTNESKVSEDNNKGVNMKKLLIGLLSLMVAGNAFAESDLDRGLKELDVIDENYIYTDIDATAGFFTTVTDMYSKSLPMNFNRFIEVTGIMMTPYYGNFSYRYTIPLDAAERREVKESLASKQNVREVCEDSFLPEQFMAANNFTLVYSYMDVDYRPLADVTTSNAICDAALAP